MALAVAVKAAGYQSYAGNDPINRLDPNGNFSWLKRIVLSFTRSDGALLGGAGARAAKKTMETGMNSLRRQGVREAWRQERQLLQNRHRGTRNWTPTQRAAIIAGRIDEVRDASGNMIVGHHINNVASAPRLAGEADNIIFLTKPKHAELHASNGGFQAATSGELVNRSEMLREAGAQMTQSSRILKTYDDVQSAAINAGRRADKLSFGGVFSAALSAISVLDPIFWAEFGARSAGLPTWPTVIKCPSPTCT